MSVYTKMWSLDSRQGIIGLDEIVVGNSHTIYWASVSNLFQSSTTFTRVGLSFSFYTTGIWVTSTVSLFVDTHNVW